MIRDEGRAEAPSPSEGDEEEAQEERRIAALFDDKRRLLLVAGAFVVVLVALYVLLPDIVGLRGALRRMGQATWYWVAGAAVATVAGFAAYVALFRGILGDLSPETQRRLGFRAAYEITLAGVAASRVLSAAGAGGIIVTYWALRNAGMPRRLAASRMVAFLVVLYSVYLVVLVAFGVLLRAGVLAGPAPLAGTIVPAAVSAAVILAIALMALVPADLERRLLLLAADRGHLRTAAVAAKVATVPATVATGLRTAWAYVRHPRKGALAMLGAVGYWAANVATLWASFEAFGGHVPFGVLVQGFFVGMAANLIPSPAAGAGTVDVGMIAAFLLFGVPGEIVFPAVLTYRVMSFWLPIPPGVVAYFQLRRTVAGWREERYTIKSKVTPGA
ncbi:MAG: putative heme transporter [Thermoleophilaceae bacterium]|nr:putative heme transporter [Thermoleophilaceae bacterium]